MLVGVGRADDSDAAAPAARKSPTALARKVVVDAPQPVRGDRAHVARAVARRSQAQGRHAQGRHAQGRHAQDRHAQDRHAQDRHAWGKLLPPFRVRGSGPPLRLKPVPTVADPTTFRIGTLNVLGSQHTRGVGGYAPGPMRTARASGLIRARGVDLLGLQEVQGDQLAVLQRQLAGYTIWPGRALGGNGIRLQIAFRSDLFELVDTGSLMTRFDFRYRPLPYVLLRDRATGGEFWVVDIHNSPRTQEAARDAATAAEIALFHRLRATGRPVLVTGDMNEKAEWFCKVAVGAGMVAANGGSGTGGCVLPPGPLRIDWIMGGGGVDFDGYMQDGASLAGISDHYFVHATVTVFPTNLVLRVPGR